MKANLFSHPLFILFITVILQKYATAAPSRYSEFFNERTLIDIDVSGSPPNRIKVTPSMDFPGGLHYTIQSNSRHTHCIGTVTDLGCVVLEGDKKITSRNILIVPKEDDAMYVRVISIKKNKKGGSIARVREFFRKKENLAYIEIFREYIELNAMEQECSQYINARILFEYWDHSMTPEDLYILPVKYSVKPEFDLKVTIGMVRFGEYIVDDRVDGLLNREVIWEGGLDHPRIRVLSQYANGMEFDRVYTFSSELNKFVSRSTKRKSLTLRE
ncbi:signal peptide-containing protein [Theileria equi strain WA]|uniref:Signal peptide-containing protein n=1 Tax=Theileria equi strain WA TaxID=1537102 RepID=L0AW78_THEEQ|nr:signal peptide-containing protein [Theileria equi strain WA]AFZ79852.1 signal peptide-containing protein [Theileria equi strain WA]|eukprot:XP_004829518.1 signal peptide-containing protein [Theileria equi strain WA]